MSYEHLQEYVNHQNWTAARRELDRICDTGGTVDDVLAILAATVYMEEGRREEAYAYICEGIK